MVKPKTGFALLNEAERIKVSRKGGLVKVSKGFGKASPVDRVTNGRRGALARWSKQKEQDEQDSIPSRDRSSHSRSK